ncbi:MAG: hypothetical protein HFJ49_02645 [Clostridia bacterium]|nr:hypothetical protein [Clostridia bacterium]
MNIVFYVIIFAIGIVLGNLYKLEIKEKNTGLKILTGILFVLFAIAMKINVENIEINNIITLLFIMLYIIFIVLVASTDKNNRNIEKSILAYGIIIAVIYIIYLCIIEETKIYNKYPIYLLLIIALLVVDNIKAKRKAENNYTVSILMIILIMTIFTREYISIVTITVTLIMVALYVIINKIKNKKKNVNKPYDKNIKIGLILSITNMVIFLSSLLYANIIR